jgi:FKBP-type peptidyl-prolyl cis-trans isomerase
MNNKWVTIIFAGFMIYAMIKYPGQAGNQIPEAVEKKNEFVEKFKYYADILMADPKEMSLSDKETPLINQDAGESKNINKNQQGISIKPEQSKANSENFVQNKIYNVLYNLLNTKQGQTILERALTIPQQNSEDLKTKSPPKESDLYKNNSILNVIEGEGEEASCGDILTVHYVTRLVSGQEIENTRTDNKPKIFQIGDQQVIKGIEYAAIGMKKGGIRRLITFPRFGYIDPKFSKNLVSSNEFITIDIELIDIKPALDDWQNKIKIFQKPDENNGIDMLCSNEVYFNYKILTSQEKLLFKSQGQVNFIIGSSQVPAAINKAFLGIKSKAKRIVMMPSSLLYNKKIAFLPENVKLPAKEMLIFEIDTDTTPIQP